ncbi:unnamed protein product [Cylicocyclus nassatus]|uniref:Uncharacterized protein n=1 Tax=Cylicocyclus nassatus TaxID=53992 RepID=A0AA36GZ66_CYLNA|nr:unnamed protein product [Cylicocyclus nassatus]
MLRRATCHAISITAVRYSVASAATSEVVDSVKEPYVDFEENVRPNPHLSLFPSPKVVVPTFELTRRLGTVFSQTIYQIFFERSYNKEGLVRAANEGVSVLGECIANEEWNRMSFIATKALVEQTQFARKRCTPDQLALLRFSPDDAVLSFIHSSFLSARDFRNRKAEQGIVSIYFTIASFIRKNQSVPWEATLPQLLAKYRKDVIVSNVTFARNISPLGQWRATGVNFFELDDINRQ